MARQEVEVRTPHQVTDQHGAGAILAQTSLGRNIQADHALSAEPPIFWGSASCDGQPPGDTGSRPAINSPGVWHGVSRVPRPLSWTEFIILWDVCLKSRAGVSEREMRPESKLLL